MARGKLTFFEKEDIERVHRASIRILEEIGVHTRSPSVEKMLLDAGAMRIAGGDRIAIPEQMVKAALSAAPKSVLLAGRNGVKDIRIPDDRRLYASSGGEGVYIRDFVKGTRRTPSSDDLRDIAIIAESMPQIDFFWELVGAQEEPDERIKGLIEFKTSFSYTNKHLQGGSLSAEEAMHSIEMASVITGGQKELAKRPIFSSVE